MTPEDFTDLFRQTVPRVHAYAIRQVGRDAAQTPGTITTETPASERTPTPTPSPPLVGR